MAGIYLHIPFCKKACHYCDFHFTTSLKYKNELLHAMNTELHLRKDYLKQDIETIYFGGGTPSVISTGELERLINTSTSLFTVNPKAEITMEANPDDLDRQKVQELRHTPVNRFSIGIQSFFEEDLLWMNRAHNAVEAESSVKRVQDAGFENITVDLIYGYPLLTNEKWISNIRKVIDLQIPHISAYSMTVEPQTALASFIKKGKQANMNDAQSAEQFLILMDMLEEAGYEHYEISNFAKPGSYSRHNSNYWKGVTYLGIGPSAHSFDGESRQWNVANNAKYIDALLKNSLPSEWEVLSTENKLNEYIMTSLRTIWGMSLSHIEREFGSDHQKTVFESLQQFLDKNWVISKDNNITLTRQGKLYADHIAAELFITSEED
ncbi:radical SAM family heme chaperone HemW [Desertivirga xinjiangensis]|uniref:radical SAM family heme chaperone HemW n=1 Tax=Desertivirga xinjiangensis TaxID=539206 RepID=UPI00210D131D|nr:radical SAM family heme chaperone HemW [Pedobacter xinjiangensis]